MQLNKIHKRETLPRLTDAWWWEYYINVPTWSSQFEFSMTWTVQRQILGSKVPRRLECNRFSPLNFHQENLSLHSTRNKPQLSFTEKINKLNQSKIDLVCQHVGEHEPWHPNLWCQRECFSISTRDANDTVTDSSTTKTCSVRFSTRCGLPVRPRVQAGKNELV